MCSRFLIYSHPKGRGTRAIIYSKGLVVRGQVERANGVTNLIDREFIPLRISKTDIQVKSRDFG